LALFALKLNPSGINRTLTMIQNRYDEFFPGNPFDFFFLDEYFDQQYQSDTLFGKVFGIFSFLAVFITSLGILGLVAFMVTQRTKEIGIRKVFGAGIGQIFFLISIEIIKLILISFIILFPIMYWGIDQWLQLFAKRMDINAELFLIPLLVTLFITIFTIGTHVIRAAVANPVEALRYE
jgi:putative ABC transport system permease protein